MNWISFVKKNVMFLFILLITYLYIYGPPFRVLPVNISLLLCLIPYLWCAFNKSILVLCFEKFKIEILLLVIISMYSLAVSFLNGGDYFFYFPILFAFFYIPMSIWLCLFIVNKLSVTGNDQFSAVVSILSVCSIVASVISVVMFLNPELAHFIKFDILKYDEDLLRYQLHRGFGISDELLFSFSIVQAVISIFYFRCFGVNLYSIVLFLLSMISILLNARIGVFFLLFTPLVMKKGGVFKFSILCTCAFLFLYSLFSIDYFESSPEIKFISGQAEYFFSDLFDQNSSSHSTIGELIRMVHFPSYIGALVFGTGENVFLSHSDGSDVGYILFLYYGGFIFIVLFLIFFILLFFRVYKTGVSKMLLIFIFFVVAVAQVKGVFVEAKPGMRLFFLIYVCLIMYGNSQKCRVGT